MNHGQLSELSPEAKKELREQAFKRGIKAIHFTKDPTNPFREIPLDEFTWAARYELQRWANGGLT